MERLNGLRLRLKKAGGWAIPMIILGCSSPPPPLPSEPVNNPSDWREQARIAEQPSIMGDDRDQPDLPSSSITHYTTKIPTTKLQTMDELLGFREGDIITMLGQPELKRSEWPAEIWQYASKDCILDIVLYHQKEGLVAHYTEERDRQGGLLAQGSCLTILSNQ